MNYDQVFDSDYGTVYYNAEHNYVYHVIKQPAVGAQVRDVLEAGLEALKANGASKWLSDDRKNGPVVPEDVEWSLADWGPRTAAEGWTHWALVVPEEVAGRASMAAVVEAYYKLGVHVAVFTELEEAETWLTSR